ncbi:hypothetical protein SLEP1_g33150 [Rubroshorea leprosula]|uniref:CG-1 domain-containing protein n=1 Tax=Rubroshorea leprosula TaxID=152421 RepID=A0AAV5KFP1_9ROSI|nr:hypothetical protein SLEP1_g33150 [Rubroshorea leprosula]
MAEARRYVVGNQLDIEQILLEAQHRWLRPAEICEVLENYQKYHISAEPPNAPPSGSLFLFDRKVLRYFRKDGHNWRKKKDGKTVKEAHEKLKVGSVDVLHCYYAHGEENENFQRRSYWMLEEKLSHIVFVHYLEVKGNRANFNRVRENEAATPYSQEMGEIMPNSEAGSSISSRFLPNNCQVPSTTHATDTTSLNSAHASEYEDAESVYNPQATSGFHSFYERQQPTMEKFDAGTSDPYVPQSYSNSFEGKLSVVPGMDIASIQAGKGKYGNDSELSYESQKQLDFLLWEDILENFTPGMQSMQNQASFSSTQPATMGQILSNNFLKRQEFGGHPLMQEESQVSDVDNSMQNDSQTRLSNGEHLYVLPPDSDGDLNLEGKSIYPSAIRQHLLDGSLSGEGLKKLDSFSRWMSKELGDVTDVDESHMQSNSGANWETVDNGNEIDVSGIPSEGKTDTFTLGPYLSQDQLFSIVDFSPNWAYGGSKTEVLIRGRFLKSPDVIENCKWSCMFGEVEVPAKVVADGVLHCHTPTHEAGWVPFYVTCSNRLACSEVREFEYRVSHSDDMNTADNCSANSENLLSRFGKFLSLSSSTPSSETSSLDDVSQLSSRINSLLKDTLGWEEMLKFSSEEECHSEKLMEELHQKMPLKEKLRVWLIQKVAEGGKGPSVLDEGGQGVLHFAAALGYDWAFEPTVVAGVSVNFRDVNGWTALHWAASCGRERAVASLISLGAAPGAVTDPSPKYPLGRAPADLASANGHKGIAGYLAECSLSAHLSSLNLDNQDGHAAEGAKAVQEFSERTATPFSIDNTSDVLSLEDSLAAVRNANKAFSRIHQVNQVHSFQKKQLKEYGDDNLGMSEERALSLLAVKSYKPGQKDKHAHAAATRIQNKFRGWKDRKQFMIIREKIVKIQAHVRGHQVRKNYRKITWSVGILEKVILRWRRKGSGLRGFKPEAPPETPNMHEESSKDDDYDFLKEGRKQTEERMQKALARVKSMVQYPEGRDQYRRLLHVATEIQEKRLHAPDPSGFDELLDIEALLDDDSFMSTGT